MSSTAKATVWKVNLTEDSILMIDEEVAVEVPVNIYINKQHIVTLLTSPSMLTELAVGHLFTQGFLEDKAVIDEVLVAGTDIHVKLKPKVKIELESSKLGRVVTTACTSLVDYLQLVVRLKANIESDYQISAEEVVRMVAELNDHSRIFKVTGGVHSAAIFESGRMIAFTEDVGRHNAVDKVIGASILKDADLGRAGLVTSGRQPADIVAKAAQMGIPFSISISGPIHSGVKLAEKVGITLICFARGKRFNIYSSPDRVRMSNGTPVQDKPKYF